MCSRREGRSRVRCSALTARWNGPGADVLKHRSRALGLEATRRLRVVAAYSSPGGWWA